MKVERAKVKALDTPLGQFCLRPSGAGNYQLVPLALLNQWEQEQGAKSIEALLVRNHIAIRDELWMEMVTQALPEAPCYPVQPGAGICEAAISRAGLELYEEHFGIILQDWPYLILGVLNLRNDTQVVQRAAELFPGQDVIHRTLSPRAFSYLGAKIEARAVTMTKEVWRDHSYIDWAEKLGFEPNQFTDLDQVLSRLWLDSKETLTVLPPGYIQSCTKIEDLDAMVVASSQTTSWVVSYLHPDNGIFRQAQQVLGKKIVPLLVPPKEFRRLYNLRPERTAQLAVSVERDRPVHVTDWRFPRREQFTQTEEWVDKCLDHILLTALEFSASDIHFEPKDNERVTIRLRINGDLVQEPPINAGLWNEICRRLKKVGAMRPETTGDFQDGAAHIMLGGARHDFRFAVLPTLFGDAFVIRHLSARVFDLTDLNLAKHEMNALMWFLSMKSGLLVTAGPTGSGKTTTLYACLKYLAKPSVKIITVEHPVEKIFEPAVQIEVSEESGKTFDLALRGILRNDPNVIMIGEVRDKETARTAINAALTGHLVLTTIHANSPVGIIERFQKSFGIDPQTLANSLKLGLYQRLVPRLCPHCRIERPAEEREFRFFHPQMDNPIVAERRGCDACRQTGVSGRISVIEMMAVDDKIRNFIVDNPNPRELARANADLGNLSALDQAAHLLYSAIIDYQTALTFAEKPFNE